MENQEFGLCPKPTVGVFDARRGDAHIQVRLCRILCGEACLTALARISFREAEPREVHNRRSLTVSQRLTAQGAAKPRSVLNKAPSRHCTSVVRG